MEDSGKLKMGDYPPCDTWKELEELVDEGKIKSLGVEFEKHLRKNAKIFQIMFENSIFFAIFFKLYLAFLISVKIKLMKF